MNNSDDLRRDFWEWICVNWDSIPWNTTCELLLALWTNDKESILSPEEIAVLSRYSSDISPQALEEILIRS